MGKEVSFFRLGQFYNNPQNSDFWRQGQLLKAEGAVSKILGKEFRHGDIKPLGDPMLEFNEVEMFESLEVVFFGHLERVGGDGGSLEDHDFFTATFLRHSYFNIARALLLDEKENNLGSKSKDLDYRDVISKKITKADKQFKALCKTLYFLSSQKDLKWVSADFYNEQSELYQRHLLLQMAFQKRVASFWFPHKDVMNHLRDVAKHFPNRESFFGAIEMLKQDLLDSGLSVKKEISSSQLYKAWETRAKISRIKEKIYFLPKGLF